MLSMWRIRKSKIKLTKQTCKWTHLHKYLTSICFICLLPNSIWYYNTPFTCEPLCTRVNKKNRVWKFVYKKTTGYTGQLYCSTIIRFYHKLKKKNKKNWKKIHFFKFTKLLSPENSLLLVVGIFHVLFYFFFFWNCNTVTLLNECAFI